MAEGRDLELGSDGLGRSPELTDALDELGLREWQSDGGEVGAYGGQGLVGFLGEDGLDGVAE